MSNVCIGSSQAQSDDKALEDGKCVGIARFTAQVWNGEDGRIVMANHSVELRVRFDPTSKKWELIGLKEWEGKF